MSGFPKRKESDCDCFDTGHSSTSISAGIGLVKARDLLGGNYSVISVIGDGALTGGMAFEALNNASQLKSNFIIVLNDNQMSIAENVGGISQYLNGLRSAEGYNNFKEGLQNTLEKIPVYGEGLVRQLKKTKSGLKQLVIPGMFFENMGITYLGPVDGHNMDQLIRAFNDAKRSATRFCFMSVPRREKATLRQSGILPGFMGRSPLRLRRDFPSIRGQRRIIRIFSPRLCANSATGMIKWWQLQPPCRMERD